MKYALGNMLNGAGGLNPDGLSLDLQFAADKTLTARKGPTPVLTRGSAATQVGSTGLIEWAPENLLLRSQEFNLTWGTNNSMTVTPDAVIAPDGTMTADAINFDSNVTSRIIQFAGSAAIYTFSVWLRANSATTCLFDGQAVGSAGSPVVVNVTTNWQRFTYLTSTFLSGTAGWNVRIQNNSTGTSGTIFAWGAQLERHPSAREYIPTTTAALYGPRFDHDPANPTVCRGLLIEESRTNLCLQSETFGTTWVTAGTASITNDQSTAPNGTISADLITVASGTTNRVAQTGAALTNTTYTFSVFAKSDDINGICIRAFFVGGDTFSNFIFGSKSFQGTTGSGSFAFQELPNGWFRISVTTSSLSNGQWDFRISGLSGVTQTGTKAFIWGAQVEAGSFPTSYIPTTTASVVRSADVCSITAPNFATFWNNNEGTVFASGDPRTSPAGVGTYLMANSGVNSNQVSIYRNSTVNFYGVANSGSYTANITSSSANGSFNKIAGSYITNDARAAFNNILGTPDTSVIVPTNLTRLNIGSSSLANSEFANGCIAAIRYYKKPLSNAKLQALTA